MWVKIFLEKKGTDLRTLILLAKKLEKVDLFDNLLANPNHVQDALWPQCVHQYQRVAAKKPGLIE